LQPQSTVTGWFAKPSRIAVKCCATVTSTSSLRPRLLRGGVMATCTPLPAASVSRAMPDSRAARINRFIVSSEDKTLL
jgi:hypothetical protein